MLLLSNNTIFIILAANQAIQLKLSILSNSCIYCKQEEIKSKEIFHHCKFVVLDAGRNQFHKTFLKSIRQ